MAGVLPFPCGSEAVPPCPRSWVCNCSTHLLSPASAARTATCHLSHFQKASRSRAKGRACHRLHEQWISIRNLLISISNGFPQDHCFNQHPSTPQRLSFCPLQRCPHSFPCQQSLPRPSHLGCCQSENILLLMKNKTSTHSLLLFAELLSGTKTPS